MKCSARFFLILVLSIVFTSKVYPVVCFTNQIANIQHNSYFVLRNSYFVIRKDTIKTHPGKKAAIFSAILPGLGQASNKKYWKIPIIYALGATTVYFAALNHDKYVFYRDAFICINDTTKCDDPFPPSTVSAFKLLKDESRRDRDWFIILSCAVYALNIIDASVDAHLLDFDISDDLSLSVQPGIYQSYYSGISWGFSFKLSF